MDTPSREEVDAKLATIEVRMESRVASIEGTIDGFVSVMNERGRTADERARAADERGRAADKRARVADERMARLEAMSIETTNYVRSLKNTIFGTAVAVVLGVAALNATILSNMLASFESGKNAASVQVELKRQTEEIAALLKRLQEQVPPPAPSKK